MLQRIDCLVFFSSLYWIGIFHCFKLLLHRLSYDSINKEEMKWIEEKKNTYTYTTHHMWIGFSFFVRFIVSLSLTLTLCIGAAFTCMHAGVLWCKRVQSIKIDATDPLFFSLLILWSLKHTRTHREERESKRHKVKCVNKSLKGAKEQTYTFNYLCITPIKRRAKKRVEGNRGGGGSVSE